jgi:hypothetical protein
MPVSFSNAAHLLLGEYLVDAWSSIEESRLTYIRNNQHSREDEDEYVNDADDESGQDEDIRLPSGFLHSPAWSAANISDCLALRKALGPVTLFVTFTTNPNWAEITSQLLPGQVSFDRPDLVVRVFHQKLSFFMKDVSEHMGPVSYYISITEFQKRGLPHAHIALALKHVPQSPSDIDKFLSAELPREQGPLREAVKKHMTHQHRPGNKYHRCGYPQKCQYNYPHAVKSESGFNERGM